jgi:organic radical activating enzyme
LDKENKRKFGHMRIYIYHDLIQSPSIQADNLHFVQRDKLAPHLQYLTDVYNLFKKYETTDPHEADYFFVPLFITGYQFSNIDPVQLITSTCHYLDKGRHILVSTGDVGQRAESKHEMTEQANPKRAYNKKYAWLDDRFILIVLESLATLSKQDIAILPYQAEDMENEKGERDIFASFMGQLTQDHLPPQHIRGGRLIEAQKHFEQRKDGILIGTPLQLEQFLGQKFSYHELMARSVFTLCPAGYGRWSFRMIEALLKGSIPVILSDDYVLPMAEVIDWKKCCIVVEEWQLLFLDKILKAVPDAVIHQMQEDIRRFHHFFQREFVLSYIAERLSCIPYADIAIGKMRGPEKMHIICVDVTNKCDLSCSNCTRLLKNQDHFWEMTPENFRTALRSLKKFGGIIAMIGGNPCVHSQFETLCEIFREEIPNQFRRGLWTNNFFKYREVIEQTFGALNLNPHNKERANGPLKDLYDDMVVRRGFNGGFYEGNSHHAPLLTAVKDLYPEKEMWERISGCDINREWSASIIQNKGELRAYFCEVAASFALARGEDYGLPVVSDWWKKPITAFSEQIKHFCVGCGVPARLRGDLDSEEIDTYTKSNADLAEKSERLKRRKIKILDERVPLERKVTQYFAK